MASPKRERKRQRAWEGKHGGGTKPHEIRCVGCDQIYPAAMCEMGSYFICDCGEWIAVYEVNSLPEDSE